MFIFNLTENVYDLCQNSGLCSLSVSVAVAVLGRLLRPLWFVLQVCWVALV